MATDKQRGDTGPGGERKAAPPRRGDAAGATQNNKVVKAQLHQLTVTFFCDSICRRTNDFLPLGTTRVVNTSMEQRGKKMDRHGRLHSPPHLEFHILACAWINE